MVDMRIIHLSCVSPPEIGGIGKVAAKEVVELSELGHDAHLASLTTHAGFRIGNAGRIFSLDYILRDADVVHLHYPFYGTAGLIARMRKRGDIKKLVMTCHMDAIATGLKGKIFEIHRRLFQDGTLKTADAILVSSRDYAEHSSFASVADRAVELPFGVDEQRFIPFVGAGLAPALTDRAPTRGATTILFVGGMDKAHAFKGIDILLRAIEKLSNVELVLVGDGDLRKSYEKQAKDLGIAKRCNFVGKLDEKELIAKYQSVDLLVLPSLSGAEAFGLVALEAQSCSTPVVASDLPGVRTVVSNNETGILVPPSDVQVLSDAISHLINDHELRLRMGENARRRVIEKFTWKKHMDGLMKVYMQLCE
jgi:glycosyltransferase involved in cell wall biosynthesis